MKTAILLCFVRFACPLVLLAVTRFVVCVLNSVRPATRATRQALLSEFADLDLSHANETTAFSPSSRLYRLYPVPPHLTRSIAPAITVLRAAVVLRRTWLHKLPNLVACHRRRRR